MLGEFVFQKHWMNLNRVCDVWHRVPESREPDGFYPINKRVWNDFSTRGYVIGRDSLPVGYDGYGCGCVLPMPAYPRVKITRQNNKSQGHFGPYKSRNWPIKLAQVQLTRIVYIYISSSNPNPSTPLPFFISFLGAAARGVGDSASPSGLHPRGARPVSPSASPMPVRDCVGRS
jgi:hypothetical protein